MRTLTRVITTYAVVKKSTYVTTLRLSDDDGGKINGVKWKLVESESANGITFLLLVLYRQVSKFLNKAFLKSSS